MNRARLIMLLSTTAGLAAMTWQDLSPMPAGVAGGFSARVNGKVVYAGGTAWADGVKQWLRTVWFYDSLSKTWQAGPELPEPLAYGGRVATADGLEVFGGLSQAGPSRNCWRLDSKLARWSKSGVLPQDGVLARVERVGKADYLFGGCSDAAIPMHCSSSVWKRESNGEWTRAGEMPDGAIALRASAALGGYVYLFGGCSEAAGEAVNHDGALRYEPATREWRKLRPLPVPLRSMSGAVIGQDRILLAGGYSSAFTNEVWIYNTRQDRYERAVPLPFAVAGIDLVFHDGLILALGGEDRMRSRSRRFLETKLE